MTFPARAAPRLDFEQNFHNTPVCWKAFRVEWACILHEMSCDAKAVTVCQFNTQRKHSALDANQLGPSDYPRYYRPPTAQAAL